MQVNPDAVYRQNTVQDNAYLRCSLSFTHGILMNDSTDCIIAFSRNSMKFSNTFGSPEQIHYPKNIVYDKNPENIYHPKREGSFGQ